MTHFPNVSLLALGLCTLSLSLGGCATGRHVSAPPPMAPAQTLWSVQSPAELERACESGDAEACEHLGQLYGEGHGAGQDFRLAAARYEKACMANDADACNHLGLLYAEGHGVSRDATHAAALYERACMAGLPQGCNNLGLLYASSTKAYGEFSPAMGWLG